MIEVKIESGINTSELEKKVKEAYNKHEVVSTNYFQFGHCVCCAVTYKIKEEKITKEVINDESNGPRGKSVDSARPRAKRKRTKNGEVSN